MFSLRTSVVPVRVVCMCLMTMLNSALVIRSTKLAARALAAAEACPCTSTMHNRRTSARVGAARFGAHRGANPRARAIPCARSLAESRSFVTEYTLSTRSFMP